MIAKLLSTSLSAWVEISWVVFVGYFKLSGRNRMCLSIPFRLFQLYSHTQGVAASRVWNGRCVCRKVAGEVHIEYEYVVWLLAVRLDMYRLVTWV